MWIKKFFTNTSDTEKAINLYTSGVSLTKIAKFFRCSLPTLRSLLIEHNCKIRDFQDRPGAQGYTENERDFLIKYFPDNGAAFCAKSLRRTECSVRYQIDKLKLRRKWQLDKMTQPEFSRHKYIVRALIAARGRAKKKNFRYDLTYEWAVHNLPKICPVFQIPFIFADGQGTRSQFAPSLDRIDNNKGYLKSNCVFVSRKANAMKNCGSIGDLAKLYNFYNKFKRNNEIPTSDIERSLSIC